MKPIAVSKNFIIGSVINRKLLAYLFLFLAGLAGPFGFAPFRMPGLSLLSLSVLFSALLDKDLKQSLGLAFCYGLGFFGLGVSWVLISIHDYGGFDYFSSACITLLFIIYLSLFPSLVACVFAFIKSKKPIVCGLLFSSLWCLGEYLRANLMTGFPWLLLGTSQIDTPLKYLAPLIGVYGLSLLFVFAATLLSLAFRDNSIKRYYFLAAFILILIGPGCLKNLQWTEIEKEPIRIAAIQGNLAMRDKWDEQLFWNLLKFYEKTIKSLLGNQLIILPEAAIPLPASYLHDYLMNLHKKALKANSSLMLGILEASDESESHYYNAISAYGHASGHHLKHQLVPFGEYIPKPFVPLNRWLQLPEPNVLEGAAKQALIKIFNHPIASLICYEIAYPKLLLRQMPKSEWIVSISDNGWFGHSLASYQQLQMSQMLSLLVGRFQIVVNNDGLSSLIDPQGNILEGLPSFRSGILQTRLFPAHGSTPWVYWNEYPALVFCSLCVIFSLIFRISLLKKE